MARSFPDFPFISHAYQTWISRSFFKVPINGGTQLIGNALNLLTIYIHATSFVWYANKTHLYHNSFVRIHKT